MRPYPKLIVVLTFLFCFCLLFGSFLLGCKKVAVDLKGEVGNDSSTIQNYSGLAAYSNDLLYYRESASGQLCCFDLEQNKVYRLTTSLGGARDINAAAKHVFYRADADKFFMADYAGRNETAVLDKSIGFAQIFDDLLLGIEARPGPIMAFRFSTKQFDTLYDARVNRFALSPAARMIYTVDVESTGEPIQTKLRRFELDRPSATLQTADLQFQPAIVAVNDSHLIVSEVKPFGLHEYNWETGEDTVLPARSDSFALCGDSLFYLQENDALYCLNLKVTEDALLIAEEVACFAILQEKYLFYSTNEQRDWYSQAPFEKIMELQPAA